MLQSESLAGFSTPALVSLVQLPVLQPLLVLLDVCAAMMDVQSRQSSATIFELLAVVAPVLQTPNWSLMLAGVSLRNAAGDEGDALEIATFIAHCAQALMSMTLAAMLLRFMEARAEKLVTTMRAQTTSDKLANTSVSDEATSTTRTDISVDDDPLLSEAAQIQQRAAGDEASNTPSGKKTKRSKARTFEEMTDEVGACRLDVAKRLYFRRKSLKLSALPIRIWRRFQQSFSLALRTPSQHSND